MILIFAEVRMHGFGPDVREYVCGCVRQRVCLCYTCFYIFVYTHTHISIEHTRNRYL